MAIGFPGLTDAQLAELMQNQNTFTPLTYGTSLGAQPQPPAPPPPQLDTTVTANQSFDPTALTNWLNQQYGGQLGQFGNQLKGLEGGLGQLGGQLTGLQGGLGQLGDRLSGLEGKAFLTIDDLGMITDAVKAGIPVPLSTGDAQKLMALLPSLDPQGTQFQDAVKSIITGVLASQPQIPSGPTLEEIKTMMRTELGASVGTIAADYVDSFKTLLPELEAMALRSFDTYFPGRRAVMAGLGTNATNTLANLGSLEAVPQQIRDEYLGRAQRLGALGDTALGELESGQVIPPGLEAAFTERFRSARNVRGLGDSPIHAFEESIARTGLSDQYRQSKLGEALQLYGLPFQASVNVRAPEEALRASRLGEVYNYLGQGLPSTPTTFNAPQFGDFSSLGMGLGSLNIAQQNSQRQYDLLNRGIAAGGAAGQQQNLLGGVFGGAQIGSAFGPIGSLVGGGLGGLLGLF